MRRPRRQLLVRVLRGRPRLGRAGERSAPGQRRRRRNARDGLYCRRKSLHFAAAAAAACWRVRCWALGAAACPAVHARQDWGRCLPCTCGRSLCGFGEQVVVQGTNLGPGARLVAVTTSRCKTDTRAASTGPAGITASKCVQHRARHTQHFRTAACLRTTKLVIKVMQLCLFTHLLHVRRRPHLSERAAMTRQIHTNGHKPLLVAPRVPAAHSANMSAHSAAESALSQAGACATTRRRGAGATSPGMSLALIRRRQTWKQLDTRSSRARRNERTEMVTAYQLRALPISVQFAP